MGRLLQVVCLGLVAGVALAQVLQNCSVDNIPLTIESTEDAAALSTSILACPDGDFAVEWVGEVVVGETILVAGGTSLNISGAGPGAIADGGGDTQLFAVDGGSRLHLSDMVLSNGNTSSYGGAIFANQSSVSLTGNMSLVSNSAEFGGAILVYDSILSWDGDSTEFRFNTASLDGGAIWAGGSKLPGASTVSWAGDGTRFISNKASSGGAILAYNGSSVSWDGDGTVYTSNYAAVYGGAICALDSSVAWDGGGTVYTSNNAAVYGGAIFAQDSSVAWEGDGTGFNNNSASDGGAISAGGSTVYWAGEDTVFASNNAAGDGGAIIAYGFSSVAWEGNGTVFTSNVANWSGGAINAWDFSSVTWEGHGTKFISNAAAVDGGAIRLWSSTVSWAGDGTAFTSNNAAEYGGAIDANNGSSVAWEGDGTGFISNVAGFAGGAIVAHTVSSLSWEGDGTEFNSNLADGNAGGAIFAWASTVSWNGDGTQFSSNSAGVLEVVGGNGGAILASDSNVSWDGDGTEFTSNVAGFSGGAISAHDSSVLWYGDGTQFSNNLVTNPAGTIGAGGGAISAAGSIVSWNGDDTQFSTNSIRSGGPGGAIEAAYFTNLSWVGDGTSFISNKAGDWADLYPASQGENGGAIYIDGSATVAWDGKGTQFIANAAVLDGGAIYLYFSTLLPDSNTTFSGNIAGENGGALALTDANENHGIGPFNLTALMNNSARTAGGAVYLSNCENIEIDFIDVTFQSNSAGSGGAVAALTAGDFVDPVLFRGCSFSANRADGSGGAAETLAGRQDFYSCEFVGNLADTGGALSLRGEGHVYDSSFLSNSAISRGPAVAADASSRIRNTSFEGNGLYCEAGFYGQDTEEGTTPRYETVCLDCHDWDECLDCTIERGNVTPTCEASLEHTTASDPGVTLETLNIDEGYWRATNTSEKILACYNEDACIGGVTGADSYCAPGYTGPYCAVCETDYAPSLAHTCTRCSSSRRQGLLVATIIAALVAIFAVAAIFKFLLSPEVEEGNNVGGFRRRIVKAVPVQALKIIVVVWQILTQFAEAANASYPGVYQDFLSAIDVVNFDLGSVLAAGCLWSGIDFHGRLLVSTIGPLVVLGLLAMTYLIAVRKNNSSASGDTAVAVEQTRRKHVSALLLLTFLVYSSVSSMVFQTFACETLDDGVEYLRADYRIQCTDAKHKAFEVYAGIMVFVYPVGIPLLYAVLLFQRRDVLADAGADKTVAQPIAGLWEAYRPARFYYEVVECGRRILLTGVVVFIFPNDAAQIAITMLIAFFFFAEFEVLSPYTSDSDMWLSRGGHVIVFLSMFDLLVLRVDVSGERDQSQAAFAGVLVAGHVLMILAIVVEAVGIFYASRKKKVLGGERASKSPRVGSDEDSPVFESAPAPWTSFMRRSSVSEKAGPTRSVSDTVVSTGGP